MYHYLRRKLVCERLRIAASTSYKILGAGRFVRSDDILELLNRSRRGPQEVLTEIPSDLRTVREIASDLAESGITEKDIRAWSHRKMNPPPFFRINKQHRLFRLSAMLDWLDAQSCKRRYIFGELQYERRRETRIAERRRY